MGAIIEESHASGYPTRFSISGLLWIELAHCGCPLPTHLSFTEGSCQELPVVAAEDQPQATEARTTYLW